MAALPLTKYTARSGALNLASYLPHSLVPPDLGPKLYIAYGSQNNLATGTTNLHLDIADAVNVMAYVVKSSHKDADLQKCTSSLDKHRIEKGATPGALWHIFKATDADKIRKFLKKIATETGQEILPGSDPIHDQTWYINSTLEKRLHNEHGVEAFRFIQCTGDAVFIPAGAPHQVCIYVLVEYTPHCNCETRLCYRYGI